MRNKATSPLWFQMISLNSLFFLTILSFSVSVMKSICQKRSIHAAANLHYILTAITPIEHMAFINYF